MNGRTIADGGFSEFPRTYSLTTTWRIILALGGVFFVGIGGFLAWNALFPSPSACDMPQHNTVADVILSTVALGIALFGLYAILVSIGARLILNRDAIETQSPFFKKRRLRRVDIEGMRRIPSNPPSFKLIPVPGRGKPLSISQIYRRDAALDEWIKGIKDLDAADAESGLNEMMQSGILGSDREQGLARLAKAQKTARILGFVGMAIGFWLFFYPHPLYLALAANALAPIVALGIIVQSKGLFGIDDQRGGPQPSVAGFMIFPALMLAMYALRSYSNSILDWHLSLQWTLVGMLAFCLIILRIDRAIRSRPAKIIPIALVLAMPYAYGLSTTANTIFDHSVAKTYSVVVTDKHQTSGKSSASKLTLGPWAERNGGDEVRVTPSYWNAVHAGDIVTIELHPGALHMPWYRVVVPN